MPSELKKLLLKAVFISGIVKFSLLFMPFKIIMSWLGKTNATAPEIPLTPDKEEIIINVGNALNLCNRYTPWRTECYTKALTAKILLQKRMLRSTLYIGFRTDNPGSFEGHAWLTCNGLVVTGECDFSKFQVHSCFT